MQLSLINAEKSDMAMAEAAKYSDGYMSPQVMMMGGFSIVACVFAWAFVDKSASVYAASQLAFSLAFVMNHPHFLASYVLLYKDFGSRIFKSPRYFWAAVLVPGILGGLLVKALIAGDPKLMAHIVTAMFFFVGWHYVKQVFGCVIVTSAQRKMYYNGFERRVLLVNLFAAWFMSWLTNQVEYADVGRNSSFLFYGISHYRLNLPIWTLQLTYGVLALTLSMTVWIHIQRYVKTGVRPSPPGVAAFVSLYAWYLPVMAHPTFAYFIPFFHSLQYMAFVWLLKRNQVAHEIQHLSGENWRREWINRFGGFMLTSVLLGALTFEVIPKTLDSQGWLSNTLGSSPFLAAFLLFINIHHYFIDNAIWRSDNPTIKQHLFQPSAQEGVGPDSSARAA